MTSFKATCCFLDQIPKWVDFVVATDEGVDLIFGKKLHGKHGKLMHLNRNLIISVLIISFATFCTESNHFW